MAATLGAASAALLLLTACGDGAEGASEVSPMVTASTPPTASSSPTSAPSASDGSSEGVPAADSTDPAAPVVGCGPQDITVEVVELQPAASTRSLSLLVRSAADTDCPVSSPPGVALVDEAGARVEVPVTIGTLPAWRVPIDVVPGQIGANVRLSWRVVPDDQTEPCVSATAVELTLNAGEEPVRVPTRLTACNAGELDVSPWDVNAG